MKNNALLAFFLIGTAGVYSQGTWLPKANFAGTARYGAVGFSIGTKGYIGTGKDGNGLRNDFWEWNQATDVWTQKADFPGEPRHYATGFSIGSHGYIGAGTKGTKAHFNDFWEWDQASNTWAKKAPIPSKPKYMATGFSIGNKGYIAFGEQSGGLDQNLWEWNSTTNIWSLKATFNGAARMSAFGFSIGTRGYVGTGHSYYTGPNNYFWEFDPSANAWTQKANFPGSSARVAASAFTIGNFGYAGIGSTNVWNGSGAASDFYRYDPSSNSWLKVANFGGGIRESAVAFGIGCYGYVGTGFIDQNPSSIKNDFWEFYDPTNPTCCSISKNIAGSGTICSGQTSTLTAGYGGTSYSWNTGATTSTIVVTPSSATTYSVIVVYGTCADTMTGTVTPVVAPAPTFSGNNTICYGGAVTLTASGGTAYSWSTGSVTPSITVAPSATITYSLTVSIGSCSVDTSITVTVNPVPAAAISGSKTLCVGNNTTLTASGGGTYSWNTGTTSNPIIISPAASGDYTVQVTSANGCTDTATATIYVIPFPTASIAGNDTVCQGEILTASGGGNYFWNSGATTNYIVGSPAGLYSVIVSNWNCSDTASVVVNPTPVANAGPDISITFGDSIKLSGQGGGAYSWSTGATTDTLIVHPTVTTTYTLLVTATNGCTDVQTVTVFVKDLECSVYIPNAFSPNSDDREDMFYVFGKCIVEMKFIVFDRWGEKVFETNDPSIGWDGIYNGKMENSGVFMYYFDGKMSNGEKVTRKGNITLMR